MTYNEQKALNMLESSIQALDSAIMQCLVAGFGSMVLGPLDDSRNEMLYAIRVIKGEV
jgi:hypothetical protein